MTEKRLRLMHVVFSLETGGLENGVVNLCNRLDTNQFLPSICVFRGGGALEARLDISRVELLVVNRHGRYDPTLPFRLAWHLRHRRIDILHTHSWGTLVEGVMAAALARTPVVIHGEHGVMEERPRNVPIQRWLWSRAHPLTAVTDPLADRMASVVGVPRERIQVILNGVDTNRFRPREAFQEQGRRQFGLPLDGLVIGMVARLVAVKNHLGVLHAVAQLKANGVHATLALAGDGPLHEELRQVARDLMLGEQVRFMGNVAHVEQFLNTLDVFVLNSHSEGMSNTLLEAMVCGIPVVATSVGANPMLVANGETGYLVPDADIESLSNALTILAGNHPLRQAMGSAGRRRAAALFCIDNLVLGYSNLYHQSYAKRLQCTSLSPSGEPCRQPTSVDAGQVE